MSEHAPGWYDQAGERRYWDGTKWVATGLQQVPMMPPPRKEPVLSLLASFLIPGLGSMINGQVGIGLAFLGTYIGALVFMVCLGWVLIGFVGLPIAIGAWVWSMVDAYQGAVTHNRYLGYPY